MTQLNGIGDRNSLQHRQNQLPLPIPINTNDVINDSDETINQVLLKIAGNEVSQPDSHQVQHQHQHQHQKLPLVPAPDMLAQPDRQVPIIHKRYVHQGVPQGQEQYVTQLQQVGGQFPTNYVEELTDENQVDLYDDAISKHSVDGEQRKLGSKLDKMWNWSEFQRVIIVMFSCAIATFVSIDFIYRYVNIDNSYLSNVLLKAVFAGLLYIGMTFLIII